MATAIGVNFSGGTGNNFAPPDTDGSIGPNHYVQFINGRFAVYNKTNGNQILAETDTTFWNNAGISSGITGAGLSDTRVFYDALSGHWFAVEINVSNTGNQVLVGRSDSSDPSLGWKATNYTGDSGFADYPTLGVDANAVMIGTNNFTSSVGSFSSVTMTTIPKADLLLGVPSVANRTTKKDTTANLGFTLQGVTNPNPSPSHSSIVAINTFNFGQINDTQVTGTSGPGASYGPTTVINTASTSYPGLSRQPDGTQLVDGNDDRIAPMVYQVGDLIFMAHGLSVNSSGVAASSGVTTNAARITVIRDSTKALVTEATYYNTNYDYTYPAIAVNSYGDIVMGFTRSSLNQGSGATNGNLGSYATYGRIDLNNPTAGITFSGGDIQLKAGNANDYHLFGGPGDRWGDFSATGLDPSNPTSFWTTQEFAFAGGANTTWGTQISQIFVSPQATGVSSTAANGTYGTGATIPITVTFNDAVDVTGTPTLLLNTTGGPAGVATYVSGSGTNTLTFNYVVSAGQSSPDLDYTSTTALTLPGGATIKDHASGLDAIVTLAAPGAAGSLGANKDIVIDAVAPTVLQYRVLFGSSSYNLIGSGRFDLPWQIDGIQVVFSKPIATGNTASLSGVTVNSLSGLGTTTLTFGISPIVLGNFVTTLSGSGVNALKDSFGNALNDGAGFGQNFKVLYGDFNDNGSVTSTDLVGIYAATANYNLFADLNGDGVVDSTDVTIARHRAGTHL